MQEIDWDDVAKLMGYPYEKAMFDDLYVKQRVSVAELAKRLNVGTTTIKRRIEGCMIELRGRGGKNNHGKQTRKVYYLDQRIVLTENLNELSEKTGISRGLFYKFRRERLKANDEVLHYFADWRTKKVQQPELQPSGSTTDPERGIPPILPREEGQG